MINLNDTKAVIDIQGGDSVIQSIDNLPKQLVRAWEDSRQVELPNEFESAKNILVCGMGGSRFPALIIKSLFKDHLKIPLEIQDDYYPPAWINRDTLVILSSYSGTTEEVLSSGKIAKERGATKFLGITSGGEVATFCKENKSPVYVFDPTHNPSGQPRIGVGYTVGAFLGLLTKLGLIEANAGEIEQALSNLPGLLAPFKLDVPSDRNTAKQLAQKIYQHYPYYIVSEHLTGVGNAIQNQTNETAKGISSYRVIPELNHHLMEGLKLPQTHTDIALFIFFYSSLYSPSIQKRFKITQEVVEQNKIATHWHEVRGATKLEQAMELLGFGGYLTMYLSALNEQDPTAIPYVDYFKKKLRK